jgi:hypothetical protein
MNVRFKIGARLLSDVRRDLHRQHPFAHERVGFLSAGLATYDGGVMVLAREYRPVADEDYVRDRTVGAMMAPEAIRKAQEWALLQRVAIFHVHTHGGLGIPSFSGVDLRENPKFVPDFLKVAPQNLHGAIVLSGDAAFGQFWAKRHTDAEDLSDFVEVGSALRYWGRA